MVILEILPKVLQETTEIDFFIHDSDHSYEVMKFECDLASEFLNDRAVLIADNVDASCSFL